LTQMRMEREAWLKTHAEPYSEADQQEYFRLFSERVQDWLDAGAGSCLLRDERAAEIVANALKHFDGQRYELGSWVVMPNHVHALVTPREGWELDKILHSWKSFTSHEIDKTLGRSGTLWQHEGYDHIVRNPRALWRIEQYIAENPAKAGITTQWVHSRLPEKSEATVPVAGVGEGNRDDCSTFADTLQQTVPVAQFPETGNRDDCSTFADTHQQTVPVAQFPETGNRDDCSTFNELELIRASGSDAADLEEWLRNDFFQQHCDLFHQRPFIWHIWDGRKRDGFHALVNYHTLADDDGGRRTLENLTHSYLGDWITRQKDSLKRGEEGADERMAAALALKERLEAIIEGKPPFDIFVRWKRLDQQAIGWEPDINDGVRMNIRPFLVSDLPNGKKGAGILRSKPNIKWEKDRGNEPQRPKEDFPWFWKDGKFTGERVNDVHLTNDVKAKVRKA